MATQENQVFISYKREEREYARSLRTALKANGFDVWWDEKIQAGEKWSDVLDSAIMKSTAVLVIWSQLSVKSEWVKHEASIAKIGDKLVQVSKDGTSPPSLFGSIQYDDLSDWNGSEESPLLVDLGRAIKNVQKRTVPPKPVLHYFIGAGFGALVLGAGVYATSESTFPHYVQPLDLLSCSNRTGDNECLETSSRLFTAKKSNITQHGAQNAILIPPPRDGEAKVTIAIPAGARVFASEQGTYGCKANEGDAGLFMEVNGNRVWPTSSGINARWDGTSSVNIELPEGSRNLTLGAKANGSEHCDDVLWLNARFLQ